MSSTKRKATMTNFLSQFNLNLLWNFIFNSQEEDVIVSLLYIIHPCNDFYWRSCIYLYLICNISVHWRGSTSRIETSVYVICQLCIKCLLDNFI